jgi:hypothetical protein
MTKRLFAIPLVLVLALSVGSTSVFAEGTKKVETITLPEVKEAPAKGAKKADAKLKTDMEKLVNEARAGKVAPKPQQFPQTSRRNLSKTTKIAILASAIGATIFLIVLFHDLSKD